MAADTLAVPFPVHCRHWPTCAAQTWTCRLLPDRTEQCSPFTSCRFGLRCMYYTTCRLLISALKFTYSLNSLNGWDALFNLHVETACRRSRYEITPKGSLRRDFETQFIQAAHFRRERDAVSAFFLGWLYSEMLSMALRSTWGSHCSFIIGCNCLFADGCLGVLLLRIRFQQ